MPENNENLMTASTIDEVIEILEHIIQTFKSEQNPLGYFAALYQKVTIRVKGHLKLIIFIFYALLLSSCGGYMIENGLSSDEGTLNPLNGPDGDRGIGATIGIRYKRMLGGSSNNGLGRHGVGVGIMYHLNGYGTEGESNPFIYRSIAARYYFLLNQNDYVKCYLSGRVGFGGQSDRDGFQNIALLGASMDVHFFKKEFLYLSPKINYIRNLEHGGDGLSYELTIGVMLRLRE